MTPWELDRLLQRLSLARGPEARRFRHTLRNIAAESWFDAHHASAVSLACAAAGLAAPDLALRPPGLGESWLLLYDRAHRRGAVTRLRRTGSPGSVTIDVDRALLGLRATCGRLCRALPVSEPVFFETDRPSPNVDFIEGQSHGVAVCAAMVSSLLGRAPRSDTAASAAVDVSGNLMEVAHLAEKLAALREARPQVTRVVVSETQPDAPPEDIRLIRATRLEHGLFEMGVDPGDLPDGSFGDYQQRLMRFRVENDRDHTSATWRELALDAWDASHAFRSAQGDQVLAAESASWAALFSLHAGDASFAARALEVVRGSSFTALPPALRIFCSIVDASRAIDQSPETAPLAANAALESCRALDNRDRQRLLGLAIGTLGRALMHAGRLREAEPALRDAALHHERNDEREAPRSCCYLATCLRLQGRLDEALSIVDKALALCAKYSRWPGPAATRLYLSLEQGRCLLAAGRPEQALPALEPALSSETDHPRVSALRTYAKAKRQLGDRQAAHDVALECARIARRSSSVLARVAILAVGDCLLTDDHTTAETAHLRALWLSVFPTDTGPFIRETLRISIY